MGSRLISCSSATLVGVVAASVPLAVAGSFSARFLDKYCFIRYTVLQRDTQCGYNRYAKRINMFGHHKFTCSNNLSTQGLDRGSAPVGQALFTRYTVLQRDTQDGPQHSATAIYVLCTSRNEPNACSRSTMHV